MNRELHEAEAAGGGTHRVASLQPCLELARAAREPRGDGAAGAAARPRPTTRRTRRAGLCSPTSSTRRRRRTRARPRPPPARAARRARAPSRSRAPAARATGGARAARAASSSASITSTSRRARADGPARRRRARGGAVAAPGLAADAHAYVAELRARRALPAASLSAAVPAVDGEPLWPQLYFALRCGARARPRRSSTRPRRARALPTADAQALADVLARLVADDDAAARAAPDDGVADDDEAADEGRGRGRRCVRRGRTPPRRRARRARRARARAPRPRPRGAAGEALGALAGGGAPPAGDDPFELAVLNLLSFALPRETEPAVALTIEDFAWHHLWFAARMPARVARRALVRAAGAERAPDAGGAACLAAYSARELGATLVGWGPRHFDPERLSPIHPYTQVLLMAGEFEPAVAYLAESGRLLEAAHLALALDYYGVLPADAPAADARAAGRARAARARGRRAGGAYDDDGPGARGGEFGLTALVTAYAEQLRARSTASSRSRSSTSRACATRARASTTARRAPPRAPTRAWRRRARRRARAAAGRARGRAARAAARLARVRRARGHARARRRARARARPRAAARAGARRAARRAPARRARVVDAVLRGAGRARAPATKLALDGAQLLALGGAHARVVAVLKERLAAVLARAAGGGGGGAGGASDETRLWVGVSREYARARLGRAPGGAFPGEDAAAAADADAFRALLGAAEALAAFERGRWAEALGAIDALALLPARELDVAAQVDASLRLDRALRQHALPALLVVAMEARPAAPALGARRARSAPLLARAHARGARALDVSSQCLYRLRARRAPRRRRAPPPPPPRPAHPPASPVPEPARGAGARGLPASRARARELRCRRCAGRAPPETHQHSRRASRR